MSDLDLASVVDTGATQEQGSTIDSGNLSDPLGGGLSDSLAGSTVQMDGSGGASPDKVHSEAAKGTATPSTSLPFSDKIQASFGHHDISGISAHTGSTAAESASAMGAEAYTTGNHVVIGSGNDLHTVAHEAAHVVQQRAGVSLSDGIGSVGDKYERHADEVADKVVRGESAEGLLDTMTGSGSMKSATQTKAVQMAVGFEFESGNTYIADADGDKFTEYGIKVAEGDGYNIEVDRGNLEVVTTAFDESKAGRAKLAQSMAGVQAYLNKLMSDGKVLSKGKNKGKRKMSLGALSEAFGDGEVGETFMLDADQEEWEDSDEWNLDGEDDYNSFSIVGGNPVMAHPQATVGIKIDKLYDMLKKLSDADKMANADGTAKRAADRRTVKSDDTFTKLGWDARTSVAKQNVANHQTSLAQGVQLAATAVKGLPAGQNWDKLKGLLAQAFGFILIGQNMEASCKYVKYLAPVMQRTNMGAMYGILSKHEQEQFDNHTWVSSAVGVGKGKKMFAKGITDDAASSSLTVGGWLKSISDGGDALQDAEESISAWDDDEMDKSTIDMASATDIGVDNDGNSRNKQGAVFELRRLKQDVPHTEWRQFALDVFDMTTQVNQGQTFG